MCARVAQDVAHLRQTFYRMTRADPERIHVGAAAAAAATLLPTLPRN